MRLLYGSRVHHYGTSPRDLTDSDLAEIYATDGPLVRVNFVTSVNGAVTLDAGSEMLSSQADRRVMRLLRDTCDAILVGAGTLRKENYRPVLLTKERRVRRLKAGLTEYPTLAVVSARGTGLADHRALCEAPVRAMVVTHSGSAAARDHHLVRVADVIPIGDNQVDLFAALELLASRGLRHILCEGGPQLFGDLLAEDLVDELCLTLSPQLVGSQGPPLATATPAAPTHMQLCSVIRERDTLMLRYTRSV